MNKPRFTNSESLPFTVRIVRTSDLIQRAEIVRHNAFERHDHLFGTLQNDWDSSDREKNCSILLAEDKQSGMPIGSLRLADNLSDPLAIESEVDFGTTEVAGSMLLASRFVVVAGPTGAIARNALWKAMFLYALAHQLQWVVAIAKPPRDRLYRRLGFSYLGGEDQLFVLPSNLNIPAKVQFQSVLRLATTTESKYPEFYNFVFGTHHPDIDIFSSVRGGGANRRLSDLSNFPSKPTLDFELLGI